MTSYLFQAPAGVEGDITRVDQSVVEPAMLVSPFATKFGCAMKYAAGGVTPFAAGDAAAVVCGMLARSVPGISQSSSDDSSVGSFTPNQKEANGLMVKGYMAVKVNAGTPVRGQPVYVVSTESSGHVAGQFECSANSGNNVALSGTIVGNFTWAADGVDANGYAEVRVAQ